MKNTGLIIAAVIMGLLTLSSVGFAIYWFQFRKQSSAAFCKNSDFPYRTEIHKKKGESLLLCQS